MEAWAIAKAGLLTDLSQPEAALLDGFMGDSLRHQQDSHGRRFQLCTNLLDFSQISRRGDDEFKLIIVSIY